jgi:hypothetical protein
MCRKLAGSADRKPFGICWQCFSLISNGPDASVLFSPGRILRLGYNSLTDNKLIEVLATEGCPASKERWQAGCGVCLVIVADSGGPKLNSTQIQGLHKYVNF